MFILCPRCWADKECCPFYSSEDTSTLFWPLIRTLWKHPWRSVVARKDTPSSGLFSWLCDASHFPVTRHKQRGWNAQFCQNIAVFLSVPVLVCVSVCVLLLQSSHWQVTAHLPTEIHIFSYQLCDSFLAAPRLLGLAHWITVTVLDDDQRCQEFPSSDCNLCTFWCNQAQSGSRSGIRGGE